VAAASITEGRDDEHDPDGSTPAREHALVAGLLLAAERHLAEVDLALERLAAGLYGRCQDCGAAVPAERLAASPTALSCVRCATTPPGRLRPGVAPNRSRSSGG
jgi:RNA polymerase-binding transcription factor DksA